jgi:hypothetical protein
MSARKLGRFASLVFVLAAIFGGVGAADLAVKHTGAHHATTTTPTALHVQSLEIIWE